VLKRRGHVTFGAGAAAGFAAAAAVFAAASFGAGGVDLSPAFFFGSKMVRAEVVVKAAGVTHDFRLDRGNVRAASAGSITLRERTGDLVTIPVAANVSVRVNGRAASMAQIPRGIAALVVRDNSSSAGWIRAGGG
jgi:hypothetical protein